MARTSLTHRNIFRAKLLLMIVVAVMGSGEYQNVIALGVDGNYRAMFLHSTVAVLLPISFITCRYYITALLSFLGVAVCSAWVVIMAKAMIALVAINLTLLHSHQSEVTQKIISIQLYTGWGNDWTWYATLATIFLAVFAKKIYQGDGDDE